MRSNSFPIMRILTLVICLGGSVPPGNAMAPSYEGAPLPQAFIDRLAENPNAFQFKRALLSVTERAAVVRQLSGLPQMSYLVSGSPLSGELSSKLGGDASNPPPERVQGRRNIPIVLLAFSGDTTNRFAPAQLKKELFDGPWPSGTLTQYYSEVSNGAIEVRGTVAPWLIVSRPAKFYEGKDYIDANGKIQHCFGICPQSGRVGDLIREAISGNKGIDWLPYDNDGPDDNPSTADDDGFVDFVAFVHEGKGGECGGKDNTNIWSHRGSLSQNLGISPMNTISTTAHGGKIKIDDYVVLPSLACDGSTMIPIGVVAHEFGHAFGLPDLYDTYGRSAGLGNWDLMATGSWGGNGKSPETPSHMSAWTKQFLGWIEVKDAVLGQPIQIEPIERSHLAYKIRVSNNIYYLLSVTDRSGFNSNLPATGLIVQVVNDTVVKAGLRSNSVNSDVQNMGVKLVEADGLDQLKSEPFRGDLGDLFPGPNSVRSFDATTIPKSIGKTSICRISNPGNFMSVFITTSGSTCAEVALADADIPGSPPMAAPAPPTPEPPATLSDVENLVDGSNVVIQGVLVNEGENYFNQKSRRIVLKNEKGEEVNISTTLPISGAPAGVRPPGGILTDFLDKKVEVRGILEKKPGKNQTANVRAAEIHEIY